MTCRRGDGECHGDKLVQSADVVAPAHRAMVVIVDAAQVVEALDDAGAHGAQQQPVHLEQAGRRGVNQQVDRLRRRDVVLRRICERVDPEQFAVTSVSNEGVQWSKGVGIPRPGCLQGGEGALQMALVKVGQGWSSRRLRMQRIDEIRTSVLHETCGPLVSLAVARRGPQGLQFKFGQAGVINRAGSQRPQKQPLPRGDFDVIDAG